MVVSKPSVVLIYWRRQLNTTTFRSVLRKCVCVTLTALVEPQLIVLAAMFKYTPEYLVSHDQVAFNKCGSPESLIPCRRGNLVLNLDVMNPVFDYVPPELVTVLIAGENEGHSPSYVYHKLSTVCHKKDYLSID